MKISEYYQKLKVLIEEMVVVDDWTLSLPQVPGECNAFIAPLTDIYYYRDSSQNTYAAALQEIILLYVVDNEVPYHEINMGFFQGLYNDVAMRLLLSQDRLDLMNIQNKAGIGIQVSEFTEGRGYWNIQLRFQYAIQWQTEYENYQETKYDIEKVTSALYRAKVTEDKLSFVERVLDTEL